MAHVSADTTGADDTYGFAFQHDRTIPAMIEAMLLPIMVRIVKFTGKVVEPSYFVRVQPKIRAALGRRSSELVIRGV